MEAIKSAKTKLEHNVQLKSALDGLGTLFNDLSNESCFGSDMISQNITTEFAELIKEALSDPLKHTYGGYKGMGDAVASMINEIVISFLKSNKKLIKRVSNPYKDNKLFYTIVLKKDTTENRGKLLSFLRLYSFTPYSKHFSVNFYFLPPQFESALVVTEEIAL